MVAWEVECKSVSRRRVPDEHEWSCPIRGKVMPAQIVSVAGLKDDTSAPNSFGMYVQHWRYLRCSCHFGACRLQGSTLFS
jgi:hypothetical protein